MNQNLLSNIRIVLVEPAGALNVGSIARIMKNMGLSKLVLVNPQCDRNSEDAQKMAVHAADVLENASIVDNLPAALTGCQRAIATTARSRTIPTRLEFPRDALPWLIPPAPKPDLNSAVIFGAEERGLSNRELQYAQRFVCIQSNPVYPSLNLAQAVAICAYELYQAAARNNVDNPGSYVTVQKEESKDPNLALTSANNATIDVLEGYYQDLETVLLEIGFLLPHTAKSKMEKFRRLYNRTNLTDEEVAMLRGIVRQMRWSMNNQRAKIDSP